jgi:hypothetical protein
MVPTNFWEFLSNIWGKLDKDERKKIEAVWEGIEYGVKNVYSDYYTLLSSIGIGTIPSHEKMYNVGIKINEPIDLNIVSIPILQDYIAKPHYIYKEGVDYTIQNGIMQFNTTPQKQKITSILLDTLDPDPNPPEVLYAPEVWYLNKNMIRLMSISGLKPEDLNNENYWRYFIAIREVMRCLVSGATIENIKRAVLALSGAPYAPVEGIISNINGNTIDVLDGITGTVYSQTVNLVSPWAFLPVNTPVNEMQPLTTDDYIVDVTTATGIDYLYESENGINVHKVVSPFTKGDTSITIENSDEEDLGNGEVEIVNMETGAVEINKVTGGWPTLSLENPIGIDYGEFVYVVKRRLERKEMKTYNILNLYVRWPLDAQRKEVINEFLKRAISPGVTLYEL